jgi:hypothetical protein
MRLLLFDAIFIVGGVVIAMRILMYLRDVLM